MPIVGVLDLRNSRFDPSLFPGFDCVVFRSHKVGRRLKSRRSVGVTVLLLSNVGRRVDVVNMDLVRIRVLRTRKVGTGLLDLGVFLP